MRLKLDHVGIAVVDLSGPMRTMEQLGLICTEAGQLGSEPMQGYPGLNARWAFYGSEGERAPILLLQPLSADGPIHDFLQKHNAGAQHLAFSVDDLERVYEVLFQAGVRFARSKPFIDPDGNRSHFFSVPGISNLLFELIEWAKKT